MGETNNGVLEKAIPGRATGNSSNGDSSTTSTASSGSDRSSTGGNGSDRSSTASSGQAQNVPRLVNVAIPNAPVITEEEKKRKRAEKEKQRRADKKAEMERLKAGSPGSTSKTPTASIDKNQIDVIITTATAIIASRPGLEVWALTPTEVSQITTPLSSMLEKSDAFSGIGEYSDQIALTIACLTILTPRIIITMEQHKKEKPYVRKDPIQSAEPARADENRQASVSNGNVAATPTRKRGGDSAGIFELLPGTA